MTTSISVANSATPRRGAGWDGYVPSNPAHADMIEKTIADVGEQHRDDIYLIYVAGFGAGCDRTFAETLKAPAVATALLAPDDPSLPAEPDWADPASHVTAIEVTGTGMCWRCTCGDSSAAYLTREGARLDARTHVADASGRAVTAKPEPEPNRCPECNLLAAHMPFCSRPVRLPWEAPEPDAGVTEGPEIGGVA